MQVLAVGAMAVGAATSAFAFDEGARKHLAKSAEAADEPAAEFELRLAGHCRLTLIIVSEKHLVKGHLRSAIRWEKPLVSMTSSPVALWVYRMPAERDQEGGLTITV
jgi:hypothetical protein